MRQDRLVNKEWQDCLWPWAWQVLEVGVGVSEEVVSSPTEVIREAFLEVKILGLDLET